MQRYRSPLRCRHSPLGRRITGLSVALLPVLGSLILVVLFHRSARVAGHAVRSSNPLTASSETAAEGRRSLWRRRQVSPKKRKFSSTPPVKRIEWAKVVICPSLTTSNSSYSHQPNGLPSAARPGCLVS